MQLPDAKKEDYYVCAITIDKGGSRLSAREYERNRARDAKKYGEEGLELWYPKIGRRAELFVTGFAPRGGGYTLVFTTTDGRYDVGVAVGDSMSGRLKGPAFDEHLAARKIAQAYDELSRN